MFILTIHTQLEGSTEYIRLFYCVTIVVYTVFILVIGARSNKEHPTVWRQCLWQNMTSYLQNITCIGSQEQIRLVKFKININSHGIRL